MPNFQPEIQDLIRKLLEVDPKKRITIEGIKHHPSFRLGLPRSYAFPGPLPLPSHIDPIDPEKIDPPLLDVLRQIDFGTEEELFSQLRSTENTPAKCFYLMLTRNIYIDDLPWPSDQNENDANHSNNQNSGTNEQLPAIMFTNTSSFSEPFGGKMSFSSSESLSVYSFAERASWAFEQLPDIPVLHTEEILDLTLPLEDVIGVIQKCLNEEKFDWFYPSDVELFARKQKPEIVDIHVQAEYDENSNLKISMHLLQGDPNILTQFSLTVRIRISEIQL